MDSIKEQSSASARSKLRYPLRSSIKPKDDKPAMADVSSSSASKRGRPASNVSKSVSVLDLSGKDKYAKPPRRLSIPAKSTASPLPRPAGTITPISENRAKRPANGQRKSETPVSDASKSLNRRKFSVLSSASYWLSQIKLSESASKHSISLAFFKLGLEAGCEPLQRLREELKAYVRRHNLGELEELAKELLKIYNIMEDLEQLQISETISQVPEESSRSSDEDVHSYASSTEPRKLRLMSLNSESTQAAKVKETGKDGSRKKIAASKNRVSLNRNSTNAKSVTDIGSDNIQKKSQRLTGQSSKKEKDIKNQGKTASGEKALSGPIGGVEETSQEDKENMVIRLLLTW
ncbi:PREDICTED: uncharacterized protein LOC104596996 isoform X2 [Nelumbo nucifera]|uniref:Uncharacterized protein LOC104596996 isoform X2 n=1 Tax=Nelumbo nucifera TaxID=4432 RepID=A0A1U8Q3T4_NELNU|nr:PREDICTED: uncharacterized protein LOC104596996 isoform X2 [Nelumbo nucifera]